MKDIKLYILICLVLLLPGCDKDFEEINTNPYAVTKVDPELLFAGSQRSTLGTWTVEHTVVQHYVIPFNAGATKGMNFNAANDLAESSNWNDSYQGPVRNLVHALALIGENPDRINLKSMIRIWKAQLFMGLVDSYGDVPYFMAGKAVSDLAFFLSYDDDAAIYDDLYTELTQALAALNPNGDYVSADLFYGANAHATTATTTATDQVGKWKKLGNSLLLRLGMRYSKLNATKAESIVAEAVAGGVMTSNADNAFVKYDGSTFVYDQNNNLRNFSDQNYAAEAFVDHLKSNEDPRGKYILATYENGGQIANDLTPDTVLNNQFGVPIGILGADAPRGPNPNGGLNYSQFNIYSVVSPAAPVFYVTYAQTSMLMAEAAFRSWIGGDAETLYEDAIRADMETYSLYPNTTEITDSEIATYLEQPGIEYNDADALELINTQYWVINIRNGIEAFANFRRSGYPDLAPNTGAVSDDLNGEFIRRMTYPDREGSANNDNYVAASQNIGGDNFLSRVFWDVP